MPPKRKQRKDEQPPQLISEASKDEQPPQPIPGTSRDEQPQPIPGTSRDMQAENASQLEAALRLLDIKECTPNQVASIYDLFRLMRMKHDFGYPSRRDVTGFQTNTPSEVDPIDVELHDSLTSTNAWKTQCRRIQGFLDECNVTFQDLIATEDENNALNTPPQTSKKPSKKPSKTPKKVPVPRSNDPDVKILQRRIMKHIKSRKCGKEWEDLSDEEKETPVTETELLDVLYAQAGLLINEYSENMAHFYRVVAPDKVKDSTRREMKPMLHKIGAYFINLPTTTIVTYPRLFSLIVKLSLEILGELNEEDACALVEILNRETYTEREIKAASEASTVSDQPESSSHPELEDAKIEVDAKEEREKNFYYRICDAKEQPSSQVQAEVRGVDSAESCSAGNNNPVPPNEGNLDVSTDIKEAGEVVPDPKAGNVAATYDPYELDPQSDEFESSSPSKEFCRRDRSPIQGESPLKKVSR